MAASRAALADLGWELRSQTANLLRAREDPVHLHCHCWPAEAALRVEAGKPGSTPVSIETTVPGYGPIASGHAQDCSRALARAIHARVPSAVGS